MAIAMTDAAGQARVVVSNGFSQFFLRHAATAAARRGMLAAFLTGAYPTPVVRRLLGATPVFRRKSARLLARHEPIPDDLVASNLSSEVPHQLGLALARRGGAWRRPAEALDLAALRLYARWARRVVGRLPSGDGRGIYHYRAGFGGPSVAVAKARGWLALCDHSIAHPAVVAYLVDHGGSLPPTGHAQGLSRFWRLVLDDIEQADHVVVNSDFVRGTFEHLGWPRDAVDVVYLGVDRAFLDGLPPRVAPDERLRLLYAGEFSRRKGADILAHALADLDDVDWRLSVCGPVNVELEGAAKTLFADGRATCRGILGRDDVAREMAAADIFVFPTLAEGSARVVFEALAAGCFVVTTPNAGSIVADGVHGRLVEPGSPAALAQALREANGDREALCRVGAANRELVKASHTQAHYGQELMTLYDRLIDTPAAAGARRRQR